jgi:hypothetical protein
VAAAGLLSLPSNERQRRDSTPSGGGGASTPSSGGCGPLLSPVATVATRFNPSSGGGSIPNTVASYDGYYRRRRKRTGTVARAAAYSFFSRNDNIRLLCSGRCKIPIFYRRLTKNVYFS